MTHARIPDFGQPLPAIALDADRLPFHADPVLAAIDRHTEAWSVFQGAPGGDATGRAEDAEHAALTALLGTACATRAGMFCLIRYLRWFLAEEASNAGAYGDAWAIARAREADLSRCLGVEPVQRLPLALPSGRLIGPTIDLRPVPALPRRAAHALASTGEALAAVLIIGGGCVLVGLASLL